MRKIVGLFVVVLSLAGARLASADYEYASPAADLGKPLVVIRFIQSETPYQQALYGAVTKAFQIKPSAKLDVVSVAVQANEKKKQRYNSNAAAAHLSNVLATFRQMQLPGDRYAVTSVVEPVEYSEVRIYVH